jgi:hypothetical protein
MGTGFLSRTANSWGQVFYREPNSWGQVFYREIHGDKIHEFMGTGFLSRSMGQSHFPHPSNWLLRVSCRSVQFMGTGFLSRTEFMGTEFMGTGFLSRSMGQSHFPHPSNSWGHNSWGQVFYREPNSWGQNSWGQVFYREIHRIHGDRFSIAQFMGTGFLSRTMGQSHFPHPSNWLLRVSCKFMGTNSWGQVFYRDPWGNRTFRTHPIGSSESVARRLTLSTSLKCPRERILPLAFHLPGRTFAMPLHALSRSR